MTKTIFSQEYKRLCWLLIEARREQGFTQEDVATALGRPQSFVSKYERGERRLDVIEFLEVTHFLGVDPHSIIRQLEIDFSRREEENGAEKHSG
jgi:transcriptional regulator with XRE-family HTH domain